MLTFRTHSNKAGNVAVLTGRVLSVLPVAHLVIVDDNSPDGTAEVVSRVAQEDNWVHLLFRHAKLGYASAVVTGLKFALSHGAQIEGYMDADLSHDPQALPLLSTAVQNGADIAIGSRYVAGGSTVDWSWWRKTLFAKCELVGALPSQIAHPRRHQRLSAVSSGSVGAVAVREVSSQRLCLSVCECSKSVFGK